MIRTVRLTAPLCALAIAVAACSKPPEAPEAAATAAPAAAALESDAQRMGYALGASVGRQFRQDKLEVDTDALMRGVREGYTQETLSLTDEQIGTSMQQLQQSHAEKQRTEQDAVSKRNQEEATAFLAKNGTAEGVVTTTTGLQYKVITAGTGAKPKAEETVKVHYRGTLLDGTEFDSSYARGEPVSFPVNAVIPGWIEALQLMPVGSKWELFIPSDLAYGPGGAGERIGPNAMLKFEVELLAIEAAQPAAGE